MLASFLLYEGFTALDAIGPYEVLASVPDVDPVFVAEHTGPVRNDSRTLALVAERSLEEGPAPDIVVVPGGFGTRRLLEHEPILSWLRDAHATSTWTTSVCTGSLPDTAPAPVVELVTQAFARQGIAYAAR